MPSSTKKRPPLEMEPGEGKAHEMKESTAEEVREGSEPDDTKAKAPSRKRSAKGAKNTKAPMDGDCGCGGKKGASCDGNCGGYAKKMGRNDALTPQEYLAACELGIQGRSRSYIRARLDAAERLDLKCGKGSISQGEKCTKGAATKAQGPSAAVQVGESASDADIKKKWLQLMRENHPDVGGDPRKAQQINAAYQEIMRRRGKLDSMYADGFDFDLEALGL